MTVYRKQLYSYIFELLGEEFNWDQFSRKSEPEESDPVLSALHKAMEDPEGRKALQQKGEEKRTNLHNILQVNKTLLEKEKKINVNSLKLLGSGAGGIAYDVGNGMVLKITTDDSEAKSSNLIKGRKISGIIQIQDVWQFPDSSIYGLIMEKIIPFRSWPEDNLKTNLEEIVDTFNLKQLLQKYQGNTKEVWKEISNSSLFSISGDPQELLQAFQVLTNIIQQVKAAGIDNFFDLHLENLGKRVSNGEIVVFDLGFSDGGTDPPVLGSSGSLNELKFSLRKFLFK